MSNSISTKDYPVKYFKEFFLEGGYDKYRNNFLSYCAKEERASPSSKNVFIEDVEIKLIQSIANEVGKTHHEITYFTDDLFKDLKYQIEISKNMLRDAQVEKFKDIDSFLHSQRVILRDIKNSNKKLFETLPECKELIDVLDDYIENLKPNPEREEEKKVEKPETIIVKSKEPKIKKTFGDEDIIKYSLFTDKDIKASFFKWLHDKLCEHRIIVELDNSEEGERQLIEVFASDKPSELEHFIKFNKNNFEAVLILIKLKEYFEHLTAINIEKSGRFLNDYGKPFNANDYNVTKSKIKKKSYPGDNDVRQFIDEFNEKINPETT